MAHINPLGRNWDSTVNWDFLGKFYISFALIWTILLYSGVIWLYWNRQLSYLKIRNIPLAITAISFLHVYLVKILAAYTINGHFPCSVEFWIMSIYLPFGIALFQANMVQLLSLSTHQRRLLDRDLVYSGDFWPQHYGFGIKGFLAKWRALNALRKAYFLIGIGMFLQMVVTASIFSTSSKLQEHWGTTPRSKAQAACRKGIEWVPSALWQLFWSCLYGPYLLYKVRNIRDTHYWRLQTILCVIFGFPGSPMWLAAAFSTKFKTINLHWLPPLWLAPGIIIMQAVTIFFPIYEAYTLRHQYKHTNFNIHAAKASITTSGSSTSRTSSSSSTLGSHNFPVQASTPQNRQTGIYTLDALEYTLATNPEPLLRFAATKDFTAESIIFLLAVREWRTGWMMRPMTPKLRALLFQHAVEIYAQNVSEEFAEYPINISGPMRVQLDAVFSSAARELAARISSGQKVSAQSPAINYSRLSTSWQLFSGNTQQEDPLSKHKESKITQPEPSHVEVTEVLESLHIPNSFDLTVFDTVEDSVRYLVATNTWRKFVLYKKEIEPKEVNNNFI